MTLSTNSTDKPKPIKILVIQLARVGDTLQSLMGLRAAKQLYPQLEIHFLARESFLSAAKRVPWIKEVIPLPVDQIIAPLQTNQENSAQAMKQAALWLKPVIEVGWDMVANWSYSETSSYLTALIPARIKLGYSRRKDLSLSVVDGWSHYIQAIIQGGVRQNIHLTDVLTTQLLTALQIHVGDPKPVGNSPVTSKAFFSLSLDAENAEVLETTLGEPTKKWVGIQLGTGNPDKTWNPEHWAGLVSLILQRNPEWNVLLLGGQKDLPLWERLQTALPLSFQNHPRLKNLVGKTGFDEWASAICRCQWLFAADTAALHLASVLGTRILNLCHQPSSFLETGPYGNGHYVVTQNASPEAVYAIWTYACQEWIHRRQLSVEQHFSQLGWAKELGSIQIFRSMIRGTQEGGGAAYEPLTPDPLSLENWTAMVIGHIARSWYCGWVPPVAQEIKRERISPLLIQKLRELNEACEVLSKICKQAVKTAEDLNSKGYALKSDNLMGIQDREQIQSLGNTLMELETLIDRVSITHPPLKAFSLMSKVLMHNLRGSQIAELGKETATAYKRIEHGVSLFQEWISQTLELAKPVALPKTGTAHSAHATRSAPGKEPLL